MRSIDPEVLARFSAPTASLCLAQVLTLASGVRVGFTDWDSDLRIDQVLCRAKSSLVFKRAKTGQGMAGEAAFYTRLDLALGGAGGGTGQDRLDLRADQCVGARLEVHWVSPLPTVKFQKVFSGQIAAITQEDDEITLDLVGPLKDLDRPVGRVLTRLCDARFGDGRCGLDLSQPGLVGAACDKAYETCRDKFSNILNFRGFPDLPGRIFQSRFAQAGSGSLDGGSRRG